VELIETARSRDAIKDAQRAFDIRRSILGERHELTAQSMSNIASIHMALRSGL